VIITEVDTDNWGWGGLPTLEYRRRKAEQADQDD
jgi:4-oxalocrotonate tautomerase